MATKDDYLQELGISALGTRLRRLFEMLNTPVSALYREFADFEQRWFALLMYLSEIHSCSIQVAASALGQSHVSILKAAKDLEAAGFIERRADPSDKRITRLALTALGQTKVGRVKQISACVDDAASNLITSIAPDFLGNLEALEDALRKESFASRLDRTTVNLK
ncbi:MAG: MarR family transcriptional regulator [Pseudomonadota bacterium]